MHVWDGSQCGFHLRVNEGNETVAMEAEAYEWDGDEDIGTGLQEHHSVRCSLFPDSFDNDETDDVCHGEDGD